MKTLRCVLYACLIGIVAVSCQAKPALVTPGLLTPTEISGLTDAALPTSPPITATATAASTETPTPTLQPSDTPAPTLRPSNTPTPTLSISELYGIPEDWQLILAEPEPGVGDPWKPAFTGFRFALPIEWTCHKDPNNLGNNTHHCYLYESPDPLGNQRKTYLQFSSSWCNGCTSLADALPIPGENSMDMFGYICEYNFFLVDGLEAASWACTNPNYDDQIDYDTDRDAYGQATKQIPNFFVWIFNGDRVDQLWFKTWNKSEMPWLFEEVIPYIHYDVDG